MNDQPIENYGIIGDLHTAALVGLNGSIDFMCFPMFNSPSIFAALLDREKGGCFALAPVLERVNYKQIYLPDTNILISRFLSEEGMAEVSDFMPLREMGHAHDLVRRAKAVRGDMTFRMRCAPRFNYARSPHRVERREGEVLFVSEGPQRLTLRLRTCVPVRIVDGAAVAEFTLRCGETAAFVLEEARQGEASPSSHEDYPVTAFKQTMNYWRRWMARSTYHGRWREAVDRSALTLKLLVSQPYGSLVAAPTFGLPEEIGGGRNWDYRYTWIRDASFSLYALIRLGYTDEVTAFMRWLEARCADLSPDGTLQVVYGIDGSSDLAEEELPHLSGYCNSRPVRIGNDARQQLQLDIYGELMDAVYLYDKFAERISYGLWENLVRLMNWLCEHWHQPDSGIWEVRGGTHEFTYSRAMCWVALDRAVRLALKRSLPAPLESWMRVRDRIYRDVMEQFWDPGQKAFVQARDSRTVDAACLLMPLVHFIGGRDPRWLSTLARIEEQLVSDAHVYRYKQGRKRDFSDGLTGGEGSFCMCSFWFAECLSRMGDLDKARFYFEKMMSYSNHLGLFAEELGHSGEYLGNYPQALTHLGLISAAFDLDRRLPAGAA